MTTEYKEFIEACFEGFDENAVNPDDVLESAERFDRIRACFLSGEPLPEEEHELQEAVAKFYLYAKVRSESYIRETDRSLALLKEFSLEKCSAMRARLRGNLHLAPCLEASAERIYNQLPKAWKW